MSEDFKDDMEALLEKHGYVFAVFVVYDGKGNIDQSGVSNGTDSENAAVEVVNGIVQQAMDKNIWKIERALNGR